MSWYIVIYLTALQASYVICDGGNSASSTDCGHAYSKLENLCYDFTGAAGDYFSVQDIQQRDGCFAVREATLYIGYTVCEVVTVALDSYRVGQDLERERVVKNSSQPPKAPITSNPSAESPASTINSPTPGPASPTPGPTSPTPGPTSPTPGPTSPTPGPTSPTPGPTSPTPGPTSPTPGPTSPTPGPASPTPGGGYK